MQRLSMGLPFLVACLALLSLLGVPVGIVVNLCYHDRLGQLAPIWLGAMPGVLLLAAATLGPLALILSLYASLLPTPSGRRDPGPHLLGLVLALLVTVVSHGALFALLRAPHLP